VHERHWSLSQMASIGGAAFLLMGAGMLACGGIGDRFIRAGYSPTLVRKATCAAGAAIAAISMLGVGYSGNAASAIWLMFGGIGAGFLGVNTFVVAQTMAGPAATGRWVGVQNTLANIAGIIAPALTGILVDRTGSFHVPFDIAAALALCSGLAWVFLVGPIVRINWSARLKPAYP